MKVLGIDSSTDFLGVGIAGEGRILADVTLECPREHATRIIGLIEQVLVSAALSKSDLTGVAVGIGPGSFTGLRIGLAVAKGLAVALNLPLVGISTCEVIQVRLKCKFDRFCLLVPLRRGEFYFIPIGPTFHAGKDITIVTSENLPAMLGDNPWGLIGSPAIETGLPAASRIPEELIRISGGELALLGADRILHGPIDAPDDLEPLYIAPSQAERNFDRK